MDGFYQFVPDELTSWSSVNSVASVPDVEAVTGCPFTHVWCGRAQGFQSQPHRQVHRRLSQAVPGLELIALHLP